MTYFVTGATGFIGRYLVQSLLQKGKGTIYVLVRPKSIGKLDELREFWGADSRKRVVPVKGDLGLPRLGVGKADVTKLKGKIKHFYHLGAVYDLEASAEAMEKKRKKEEKTQRKGPAPLRDDGTPAPADDSPPPTQP